MERVYEIRMEFDGIPCILHGKGAKTFFMCAYADDVVRYKYKSSAEKCARRIYCRFRNWIERGHAKAPYLRELVYDRNGECEAVNILVEFPKFGTKAATI